MLRWTIRLSGRAPFETQRAPNMERGTGGVICLYDNLVTLKGKDKVIPIQYL